ncbi:PH domain-like protein [Lojkania enalia]|uniref:PH domain-like protein n=1 Tax=Lojkania enalia TaxID=147567 RepID=A0A9P4KD29_9PLEO|nr:PH domain-like protein [Didymosphaeria enalia]
MPSHKAKSRAHAQQPQPPQPAPQPSDYETDAPPAIDVPLPPPRSNDELNLSVLHRHYPEIISIRHVTPYAVLYTYSLDSRQWEKIGIEGTLFVCQLSPSPTGSDRFSVVILNRRGLENFTMELTSDAELEITEEYVILQGEEHVYGIWIFSEQDSSTANARLESSEIIRQLARQAAESRRAREQVSDNGTPGDAEEQVEESIPMGRQLSLRELFGQQRQQDAAWSLHNHNSAPNSRSGPGQVPQAAKNDVLDQLFAKAKQDYNGAG